jgi:hypothetical protein
LSSDFYLFCDSQPSSSFSIQNIVSPLLPDPSNSWRCFSSTILLYPLSLHFSRVLSKSKRLFLIKSNLSFLSFIIHAFLCPS